MSMEEQTGMSKMKWNTNASDMMQANKSGAVPHKSLVSNMRIPGMGSKAKIF